MSRKEDFIQAGIDYRMKIGKPMAIGGDNFADVANEMNRCKAYETGAEYGYQYAKKRLREVLGFELDFNVAEFDDGVTTESLVDKICKRMED
jgi:hypothetical protein